MFWSKLGHAFQQEPGLVQLCSAYANGDGCSSADMTRMDHELRRRNFELLEFARRELPGYQGAYLSAAAQQVCVRSGRHISGEAKVTATLLRQEGLPPQPIVPICRSYGSHSTDQQNGFAPKNHREQDGFSAIPYGALVPRGLDNLLAAGRCLSVEEAVMDTIRMMTTCLATGQAAGTAAALALDGGLEALKQIPYPSLRQALLDQHCIVD
jgi:hypothetical protein